MSNLALLETYTGLLTTAIVPGVFFLYRQLKSQTRLELLQQQVNNEVLGYYDTRLQKPVLGLKEIQDENKKVIDAMFRKVDILDENVKQVRTEAREVSVGIGKAMHDSTAARSALWVIIADENAHRRTLKATLKMHNINLDINNVPLESPLDENEEFDPKRFASDIKNWRHE